MNKLNKLNKLYHQEEISPALVEQVLEKMGFSQQPLITKEGLNAVYAAWCRNVPFDNIRKRILMANNSDYTLPGMTPTDFYTHWLKYGVGGTCWAGHGALYALLKYVGFDVYPAISQMLSTPAPPANSPGHGTLAVYLDGEAHIVDATIYHGHSLPLIEKHTHHSVWGTNIHRTDGHWHIRWKPLGRPWVDCQLLNLKADFSEYLHRHKLSKNNSRFDGAILIRKADQESITGIVKGEKIVRHSNGVESFQALTHEAQRKLLIEHFNIAEEIVALLPKDNIQN